jgi:uncharacterized membrane protein
VNNREVHLYRRLRIAGALIIAGLAVEALSLIRIHPLSFLAFMFIGGTCFIAGVALYLYSIVAGPGSGDDSSHQP